MGKLKDLTGMKFGRLTIIEYVGNSKWLCRCDCGNEKIIRGDRLKNGHATTCGCARREDLTEQRFGRLIVVSYNEEASKQKKEACWNCKCDCGNEVIVRGYSLKIGQTTSCGCYGRERRSESKERRLDLTGQRFGSLTVISCNEEITEQRKRSYWNCKCDCGNGRVVGGDKLKNGAIISCKHCGKERTKEMLKGKREDLTGQRFGRLVVISYNEEMSEQKSEQKSGRIYWNCKCDCGNEVIIRSDGLKGGRQISCGCYHKEQLRDMAKEMWKDEEYRQWKSDRTREQWQDEETRWKMGYKGGISLISEHLRRLPEVIQWRKDTYIREDNICQLTGKHVHGGNSSVHHLYGFNIIVLEAHELHNIQVKSQVKDYTEEELHKLEEYVASWHKDTSNAVLLSNEVHDLFHRSKKKGGYGSGDNTPEQFEEFKKRFLNGEFNDSLEDDFNDLNK